MAALDTFGWSESDQTLLDEVKEKVVGEANGVEDWVCVKRVSNKTEGREVILPEIVARISGELSNDGEVVDVKDLVEVIRRCIETREGIFIRTYSTLAECQKICKKINMIARQNFYPEIEFFADQVESRRGCLC